MGKVRRCNSRCHNAKRPRCRCWCGGLFHGAQGASARATLILAPWAMPPQFKEGETRYIEQIKLPLEGVQLEGEKEHA